MADVELDYLRQRSDCFGTGIVEPVAGMNFKAPLMSEFGAGEDTLPFSVGHLAFAFAERIAPGTDMNLDDRRTQPRGRLDLSRISRDKKRNTDAGIIEPGDVRRQLVMLPCGVETAFGRAFGTLFRHQANRVRLCFERDAKHLIGRRHLEIKRLVNLGFQPSNIIVANMTTIFAQMCRYPVGAGGDCKFGRPYRIRVTASTRVTDGGNVINIHAKTKPLHALAIHPFGLGHHGLCAQLRQYRGQVLEVVDLKVDRNVSEIGCAPCHADIVDIAIVFRNDLRNLCK